LVGKAVVSTVRNEVREYLEPVQVGVGTPLGAEAIVHTARQWLHRNNAIDNKVLVTLDLENAFNSVDRSAILAAARRVVPSLAPWMDFCYRSQSHLVLGDRRIASARGVQQGDPLGPLLFSLAIHDAVLQARNSTEQLFPRKLDIVAFYLDDGVIAGDVEAVRSFCAAFEQVAASVGLRLSVGKCEAVPAAGAATSISPDLFPGWRWLPGGGIKLLGAPIGSAAFCAELTAKRVAKAEELLSTLCTYSHTQGALLLLRHCASFSKLVYTSRTVPPAFHREALTAFQGALRSSLEKWLGDKLPDHCWALAQLGISHGGLGVRDPARHAPAAYLGSLHQSRELCQRLDPQFDPGDLGGGSLLADTENELRAEVLEGASWERGGASVSQKELSGFLDAAALAHLKAGQSQDAAFQAHLALCAMPGAGAWLTAFPVEDGREIDAPLFRVALKRRLRAPVFDRDGFCPCCGGVMDRWGDHAIACACGGDRTIRQNAIRDVCFDEAIGGGLRPEREKGGLIPPRPEADDLPIPTSASGGRRPADVWLPRGSKGRGEALDFAVTSAMRGDVFRQTATAPEAVFANYEHHKRQYLDTGQQCEAAGFAFVPMVLEAHAGVWSPTARGMLDWIARQSAATRDEAHHTCSLRIAQRTSCTLHRENARAVLRRMVQVEVVPHSGGWAFAGPWQ
jgi:hypothetical protein